MPFDNEKSVGFNATQIKIAGNYVELAAAEILRDTIGNGWNLRQRNFIIVMGAQEHERQSGTEISNLLVSAWEDDLIADFNVTRPIVRKDIAGMIDFGVLEKVHMKGSKRDKTLRMTATGYSEWLEYNERMAALYISAGKAIEQAGNTPARWMDTIRKTITRLLKGSMGLAVGGALVTGASTLSPTAAVAADLTPAIKTVWVPMAGSKVSLLPEAAAHDASEFGSTFADNLEPMATDPAGKLSNGASLVLYEHSYADWDGIYVNRNMTQVTRFQTVDAADFLGKHLPEGMIFYSWTGAQSTDPLDLTSLWGMNADQVTAQWAPSYGYSNVEAVAQDVWNGTQGQPKNLTVVDAAGFLEKHLPKVMALHETTADASDLVYGKYVF